MAIVEFERIGIGIHRGKTEVRVDGETVGLIRGANASQKKADGTIWLFQPARYEWDGAKGAQFVNEGDAEPLVGNLDACKREIRRRYSGERTLF